MFNSPFDSFHNTVAEAKQEGEQLDRLLTISTPRERQLLVVIALVLSILTAWLFLGDAARSLAVDGVVVGPGKVAHEGNQSVQALIWIESEVESHFKAGMPATIALGMADREAETLEGKVVTISAVPSSEGLTGFESAVPVTVHRVDIALDASLDIASLAGSKCRVVIKLGRQSPVAFLRMRRS